MGATCAEIPTHTGHSRALRANRSCLRNILSGDFDYAALARTDSGRVEPERGFPMHKVISRMGAVFGALGAVVLLIVIGATAVSAIETEGEMFVRDRLVGNLGVAHADVGVYPDRAERDPAPEQSGGSDSLTIPDGAEIVESLVYWAGRGPNWSDDEIVVNSTSVTADLDYSWNGEFFVQTTYVADLDDAGITFSPGLNSVDISGLDHNGERFYGAGVIVIYEDPSLPEVELALLEGNEFAFFRDDFSNEVGNAAEHTSVSCVEFAPSIEDRSITWFTRILGVDAGRSDGPPRSQRLQWWTGPEIVTAPVVDGIVGIPSEASQGSVDNPVAPKVASTGSWGSAVYETNAPVLGADDTQFCSQLQSVSIGDGEGASLALSNQGAGSETVHRLGNLVWFDINDDGMADANEPGIDGVVVQLFEDGQTDPIAQTTTADDGSYVFDGLLCGSYVVGIPGGQSGWTVNGSEIDVAQVAPASINNPDANDDGDNDNNGVESGDVVLSGAVEIGDCGDDGDFSNSASNEPTNETDRKGGPDDDADEVSVADGNYDDVRSNVSVDFAFVGDVEVAERVTPGCTPGADGVIPAGAVDADGEACNPPCGADDQTPAADGDAADGTVDTDGEVCNSPDGDTDVTVEVEGQIECPAGSDNEGAVVQPGESCDNSPETDIPDPAEVEDDDGDNNDDEIEVEVGGQVEENPDADEQAADQPLAVTGSTTMLWVYGALMVLVIGAWFTVAGAWMRPAAREQ